MSVVLCVVLCFIAHWPSTRIESQLGLQRTVCNVDITSWHQSFWPEAGGSATTVEVTRASLAGGQVTVEVLHTNRRCCLFGPWTGTGSTAAEIWEKAKLANQDKYQSGNPKHSVLEKISKSFDKSNVESTQWGYHLEVSPFGQRKLEIFRIE